VQGFEDNSGALTIATLPKIRPRNKYINTKYWHFMEHMEQGRVVLLPVSTKDQIADLLTKPFPETDFRRLKERIMGKEHGEVCTSLKGSVEISESRILVAKDKEVPEDEKRELEKVRSKTFANSASMNAYMHEDSSTPKEKPKGRQCCRKGTAPKEESNEAALHFRIKRKGKIVS